MKKFKKILVSISISLILFFQVVPVMAIDMPTPPPAPAAPSQPSAPVAPSAPSAPSTPSQPSNTPVPDSQTKDAAQPSSSPSPSSNSNTSESQGQQVNQASPSPSSSPAPSSVPNDSTTQTQPSDKQVGDTFVKTGDANNAGNIATTANNNLSENGSSAQPSSGASVVNSGNGSGSTNSGTVAENNNSTTVQGNTGTVSNDLKQSSVTGNNSTSDNVGDSIVKTGDANVTGTVLTHLNTNVDGVAISEFNIADDHKGDLILDFAANCISGCQNFAGASNIGNGVNSQNNAELDLNTNKNTFQTNDAQVDSNLALNADSGNNTSSRNTGGDSFVETGNANVAANALTFVNNNLAGNVVLGVVNIFGKLLGNIVIPESVLPNCTNCGNETKAANVGNGANTQNNAKITQENNDNTFQTNTAEIENNLVLNSISGDNDTSKNTGGVSYAKTGSSSADAKVLNIANSNVDGGNWWLVIVNEAGKWVGKILGAPNGSNFAGSQGTEFVVGENGEITAKNAGNGANSQNNANVSQTNNNTIVQNNTAKVVNNLNLSANTGKNKVSSNTGGDSVVKTGDSNILANIVNFVNNNIVGNGRLLVTLVNIFGEFEGDVVTPGNNPTPAPNSNPSSSTPPQGSNQGGSSNNGNGGSQTGNQNGGTGIIDRIISIISPAASNTSSSSNDLTNSPQGSVVYFPTQVAGFAQVQGAEAQMQLPFAGKGKDKRATIKVNLAWLVVILPAGLLSYITYKKAKHLLYLRSKSS